jgi:hypothetical protein
VNQEHLSGEIVLTAGVPTAAMALNHLSRKGFTRYSTRWILCFGWIRIT